MKKNVGYSHLIERHSLPAMPLSRVAQIDSRVHGRKEQGGELLFEPRYQPDDSLTAHLQFALRYEGVNLQVLALLFEVTGVKELCQWITEAPASAFARRSCFLYEWIKGGPLPIDDPVSSKERYVPALDPALQFAVEPGERVSRFRVFNNLPGNSQFCPLVRKTSVLLEEISRKLHDRIEKNINNCDPDLLRRAASYLYLKETQSSFEVEREKPSPNKAQRFADLLRQADVHEPLTEERLVELQNAVLDPRFHEFTWRHRQNWVGKGGYGRISRADFVPPRPEDVPRLMEGLLATAARLRPAGNVPVIDPVVSAAAISFGFVFIHPFMDGNGRIHRYLIHEVLANAGFTPRGIVLPISAVILANLDDYIVALETFSRPVRRMTTYDPETPGVPATGNDAIYFRFFDATEQAEFLYRALEQTVEEDLQQELVYLRGFDRAFDTLNNQLDWPPHNLELFIRLVHQNNGVLSKGKRKRHFEWMTDEEVELAETWIREAFHGANGSLN